MNGNQLQRLPNFAFSFECDYIEKGLNPKCQSFLFISIFPILYMITLRKNFWYVHFVYTVHAKQIFQDEILSSFGSNFWQHMNQNSYFLLSTTGILLLPSVVQYAFSTKNPEAKHQALRKWELAAITIFVSLSGFFPSPGRVKSL